MTITFSTMVAVVLVAVAAVESKSNQASKIPPPPPPLPLHTTHAHAINTTHYTHTHIHDTRSVYTCTPCIDTREHRRKKARTHRTIDRCVYYIITYVCNMINDERAGDSSLRGAQNKRPYTCHRRPHKNGAIPREGCTRSF